MKTGRKNREKLLLAALLLATSHWLSAPACSSEMTDTEEGGTGGVEGIGGSGGSAGSGGAAGAAGSALPPSDEPTVQSLSGNGPHPYEAYTSRDRFNPDGFAIADNAFVFATIYYPTDAAAPLGAVVVCPGFTETQADIGWFGPLLASWGYAVLTMDTANTGDSPPQRATEIMAAVATLKAENTRSESPLFGKLDDSKIALMGHSMGGGGTLIAADAHSPELKAAIPITPYSAGLGGGASAFPNITVPTLVIAGQSDVIAPVATNAWPFSQSIPATTNKAYIELAGEPHGVANGSADGTCPSSSAFSGGCGTRHDLVGRFVISWLKLFMDGDQRYRQFLVDDPVFSRFDSTVP